jgi:hypothetical protein
MCATRQPWLSYVTFAENSKAAYTVMRDSAFDMYVNPLSATTPQTLHVLFLHELGHVYGLQHTQSDSIMGYAMWKQADGQYYQEIDYLNFTRADVDEMIRTELDYERRQHLVYLQQPPTLTSQRSGLCRL